MDDYTKQFKVVIRGEEEKKDDRKLEQTLNKLEQFGVGFSDAFSRKFKDMKPDDYGRNLGNAIMRTGRKLLNELSDVLSESWQELSNMLQYSTLSNARTRELAFTYGFSGSQAYGYDKAMEIMGFGSLDDLMFANDSQKQKFQEFMTKYTEKYNKLYDSGFFEDALEFQYEMEDFKQEVLTEVVEFFMDNKDTIKSGMMAIMNLSEFVIQALGWLIRYFGGDAQATSSSERAANTTDIINNYGGSNSRTTNISVDNTFNNVAKDDQTWLANAGQMTYQQVIEALK